MFLMPTLFRAVYENPALVAVNIECCIDFAYWNRNVRFNALVLS